VTVPDPAPASASVELLAPAGEPRALRAALAAGADAVYFGLERFSARAFAGNFAGEGALQAIELAHRWDARAYLALNTLLKDDEVEPALAALEAPYQAGLDALIVADLGFADLVRDQYPLLPLHASTQLNVHSSAQLAGLARLGFARAVLARELSLPEIEALDRHGLELEAFVHGALCYGYSGDCLLASMVGGRSGNRGRCSQACRMRYALGLAAPRARGGAAAPGPGASSAGGEAPELARVMSTSDLAAIGLLPQLVAAGVRSLKIEGRMKDAGYVGITTAVYREALDAALADPAGFTVRPEWLARLEQNFSRSFTTAHLSGKHHEVRSGGRSGHRGVLIGRVSGVNESGGEVTVRLSQPVAAGDLVYLYTPWGQSEPVRVEEQADQEVTLRVRERVALKDRVFRLAAAQVDELARDLATARTVLRPLALSMVLKGAIGEPVRLRVSLRGSAGGRLEADAASEAPLAAARTVALDEARVRDALGALGGTPYELAELRVELPPAAFLAVGELKGLRRRALAALDERRIAARRRDSAGERRGPHAATQPAADAGRGAASTGDSRSSSAPGPHAAGAQDRRPAGVRDPYSTAVLLFARAREELVPAPGVTALCLDVSLEDQSGVIAVAHDRAAAHGLPLRCRLPEVVFDEDAAWLDEILGLGWDAVYVRQLGALDAVRRHGLSTVIDYPLQGLNGLAAGVLAGLAGRPLLAAVASPEASLQEVASLAAGLARLDPPAAVEALVFGRQQLLHTRDQLGRAEGLYAAPGPHEHVDLLLRDAKDYVFPALADARGTRLYNARVTNLAGNLDELRRAGVGAFQVMQADMDPAERAAFAAGGLPALAAFASRERSTTGHMFRGVA
jgi:U32 family peptidase